MSDKRVFNTLMSPEPFSVILSESTGQPFVTEAGRAYIYSDEDFAMEQKLDYLRLCGYQVAKKYINNNKEQVFEDMYFSGVKEISLNEFDDGSDPQLADMNEFVSDSVLSLENELMNRDLSFALNLYYESLDANTLTDEMYENAIAQLHLANYFIPINTIKCQIEGQIILPFIEGSNTIPIFTDIRLMGDYVLDCNEDPENYGSWILSWNQLKNLLEEHSDITYMLNPNTIQLVLDQTKFD